MSLFGIITNAVEGKEPWSDVGKKIEGLFVSDVVDPAVVWGKQFASDFGKAALAEAAKYVPQLLSNPSSIGSLIPTVAADLEGQAITIAETDALQDANTIIGNALRTQLTNAQMTATPTSAATEPEAATPAAAS